MSKGTTTIVTRTISTEAISASGSYEQSEPIPLRDLQVNGFFSIQGTVTGDGTAKIEYECSNDGVNFAVPESATDIITGLTKTSGPGGDGKFFESFSPEVATHIRLKVTETGGASSVTLVLILAVQ